ncbi:MAG: response regulator transcription factor, partial [Chloroflexi bacterium]|nr:response regulator transcription factor [Chloroflexota bacterium]
MKKIRVLIADDHALVREGIRRMLADETDVEVVGEASDGQEAVDLALRSAPDLVIMDLSMPGVSGLEATKRIRAANESINVLGLTIHEIPEYFFSMLEAGAAGYLLKKDATSAELMNAIHAIQDSGAYLHPTVAKWLMQDRLAKGSHLLPGPGGEALSPREAEVLKLVAEGHTNQEIAAKLHLSPATVQTHRTNIMQKLDLHSRADLVKYA